MNIITSSSSTSITSSPTYVSEDHSLYTDQKSEEKKKTMKNFKIKKIFKSKTNKLF
jgi:hypothetical protein